MPRWATGDPRRACEPQKASGNPRHPTRLIGLTPRTPHESMYKSTE